MPKVTVIQNNLDENTNSKKNISQVKFTNENSQVCIKNVHITTFTYNLKIDVLISLYVFLLFSLIR